MKEAKMVLILVVLAVLALTPVGQAATTIIMDETHHNGSLQTAPLITHTVTGAVTPSRYLRDGSKHLLPCTRQLVCGCSVVP